jgi:hypothetical protein
MFSEKIIDRSSDEFRHRDPLVDRHVFQALMNFRVKVNHGLGQPGFVDTWSPHQNEIYQNDIGMSKTRWTPRLPLVLIVPYFTVFRARP